MDTEQTLKEIGLSVGETQVYLALLKLGSVPVSKIKEETNLHRTTIYDFLESLLNKGLVNYVIQNSIKFYAATDPKKLVDYVKEKEAKVNEILPELLKLSEFHKSDLKVEVYKGLEGFKTLLNELLRHGKDYVIFGIDETMFQEKFGAFMDHFFRKEKQIGFKERILTTDKATFTYDVKYDTTIYRYLPSESFNPTPTYVWGNNVGILIWEPLTVIKITNTALADSYTKYFELLWKLAKKKPRAETFK